MLNLFGPAFNGQEIIKMLVYKPKKLAADACPIAAMGVSTKGILQCCSAYRFLL
jgi:hypothetical protein